jgi:hypothetical protein
VPALLDAQRLADRSSFFKLSMWSNSQWTVQHSFGINPLSRLWQKLGSNTLLASKLSEFVKVAEVAVVTLLGSVEDECTFSTLSYMKSKVRNNLDDHLDLVVYMFGQSFFANAGCNFQVERCQRTLCHYSTTAILVASKILFVESR